MHKLGLLCCICVLCAGRQLAIATTLLNQIRQYSHAKYTQSIIIHIRKLLCKIIEQYLFTLSDNLGDSLINSFMQWASFGDKFLPVELISSFQSL